MDTEIIDEDSIDIETLQAQIDLSMSFAQSLVSSWMEPLRLPTSSRRRDLEKELSEYMKRPPRLGVGAFTPEGHQNISREAARLKGKFSTGSKRRRTGEAASTPARRTLDDDDDDDDDDESRAGAIKKKQKSDPFDILQGKKKKKHHAKNDVSEQGLSVVQSSESSQSAQDDVRKPDSLIGDTQSPSKKTKQGCLTWNEDSSPLKEPALVEDSSTLTNNGHSGSCSVVTSMGRRLSELGPTSSTPNAMLRNPIHLEFLKRPLLNLTGPPVNSDDGESDAAETGAPESPLTSPRKKKKKRRRKKKHHVTESPCHSTSTSIATPSTDLRVLQT